jgi:protein Jumonji
MSSKSPEEKKSIFQRFRHDKSKRSEAFSPENESSVYAFQSEPEEIPSGIPFRRKTKDELNTPAMHSVACGTESLPSKKLKPIPCGTKPSNAPSSTFVSPNVSSNSIAVQVNFDEVGSTSSESPTELPLSPTTPTNVTHRNSFECSTQTEEENDDDHLFYIPLKRGSPEPQQLIQGVEVKLGTQGPTGPNQRVIMRAKLVTKPPERFAPALNKTGMVR